MQDTSFLRHKFFFYTARLLRELVPAVSIGLCIFEFFLVLIGTVFGDSFSMAFIFPGRSFRLDKMMWHFSIMLWKPGSKVYDDDTHTTPHPTGIVTSLDVYNNDWDLQTTWKSSANDDWWCMAVAELEPHHVPYHLGDGQCGLPATQYNCSQFNMYIPVLDMGHSGFPDADAGWRCLTAPNLAAGGAPTISPDGTCYSMCLDVTASAPTMGVFAPMDMWIFFLSPVLVDLFFLLLWTHAHTLLLGINKGGIPRSLKMKYGIAGAVLWLLFLLLVMFSGSLVGIWAPSWWPGGSPVMMVLLFMFANMFTGLAIEQHVPPIRCVWVLWYKFAMFLVGIKSLEDAECRWPIDSDEAFCMYLVRVYKTKAALFKKVVFGTVLYFFMIFVSLFLLPAVLSWTGRFDTGDGLNFLMSQIITLMLLAVSLNAALQPPPFMVDFRAYQKKRDHYPSITFNRQVLNLKEPANGLVAKCALRYLHLEVLDDSHAVQVTSNESMSANPNAANVAGVAAVGGLAAIGGLVQNL